MSHSRKNLKAKALSDEIELKEEDRIAKVLELRGSYVVEIMYPDQTKVLATIPQRFRKLIWIKRGNYLVVREPKVWNQSDRKIRAMVEHVLFPDQIKTLKKEGKWPEEFKDDETNLEVESNNASSYPEEGDDDLFVNPNRVALSESESEDEEESDDE